jgi:glucokinase
MSPSTYIGVDLGGTNMRAGRVEGSLVVDHVARPTSSRAEADIVLEELAQTIAKVFTRETEAIGIGVPSVVDVERGVVYDVVNIQSWKEVHLKEALQDRFKVPVFVNNDANCFALGEYHFGKGRGARSMLGMVVGTGIGAGLVLDGRLYSGPNCGAGEIGAVPYRDHTYEFYASGQRFLREHGENGAIIHARALRGEADSLQIFRDFGHDFGKVLLLALYAYDPECIILGGSVSKAFPLFEPAAREELKDFAYQNSLKRLRIEVSEEPQIAILGAAALCLEAALARA